ncbi:MAG: hypothetical protein ACP5LE_03190 [Thermoplasmata archaeon]
MVEKFEISVGDLALINFRIGRVVRIEKIENTLREKIKKDCEKLGLTLTDFGHLISIQFFDDNSIQHFPESLINKDGDLVKLNDCYMGWIPVSTLVELSRILREENTREE